ncbi:hypothetical protein U1U22_001950 [Proteus mirabilis]|uniref:hypothetical protein n=1 Tax=Proteus TaxID=583 RepID=UPI001581D7D4|nr:hypothetical protein [Proteus mirabilis]ELZ9637259.1 hypothetical protein [Proteus mirabilis]MDM3567061.1 hypothetical protein [Proteus mirabilis]MDM3578133.1 hypothetical protein [Proteus mirabilis]HEI8975154.1 hypothetical protein [Proteus mirabilis]
MSEQNSLLTCTEIRTIQRSNPTQEVNDLLANGWKILNSASYHCQESNCVINNIVLGRFPDSEERPF